MKKFFALLAAATAFTATPALAANTIQDHQDLKETLERVGVEVFVNHQEHCKDNWGGGFYATSRGNSAIMICQDNGQGVRNNYMVPWTANDLDSLRHEAHHVVQDCIDDGKGDGELGPLFEGEALKDFVKEGLSPRRIKWVIETYTSKGADEETIILELEAFAVAANVGPDRIASAINKFCF